MQSDAQGKRVSTPKKVLSSPPSSSKTVSRFLNLPLVSRSISFYNSFKSSHEIIAYVLGIIEWFYYPFFRKADHLLTYVEHKMNRGREKFYDYIDKILYYPVLLAEGGLVYYVDSLRQISIVRHAFRLVDSFSDLIIPQKLERDVNDFRYQFFQNLEGNFPFLRKMRRKANIRAVWSIPKTLFFFSRNCVDSLFSSLSYIFYLLFIVDSPQEKARYIKPRSISRKASLGPISSFSSKTIPTISITPPKPSFPTAKPEPNSNLAPISSAKVETKPIPQKKHKDFSRKRTLTKGTSLHNFLTREQRLGRLPPIQEESNIQLPKDSIDYNHINIQLGNQYQAPKGPEKQKEQKKQKELTQPVQPSDLSKPKECIKETLPSDLYEKVAEPKAHKQSDFIDNKDLEEDDDFVFNTNVSNIPDFTSFSVFEVKNVDFIEDEEKEYSLEDEEKEVFFEGGSSESTEQETVESNVIDLQDPEAFPSLPLKPKKSYSDIVNKRTKKISSQKVQKKRKAAKLTNKENKSTAPSKKEGEGKYIEEKEEHKETRNGTEDWSTVPEHKHPHIPHLVKENITKLADSNPYAILPEVLIKEEDQKIENEVKQTTTEVGVEVEVKEITKITECEVIEFQPKQENKWEVVHGTAPHLKREKITDLADDSNPFALLANEEKINKIESIKECAPQKAEVKEESQREEYETERIDMQNTKDKITNLLESNPFALLHEVFNDGTENHVEKFEPNSYHTYEAYETYETHKETDDWTTVPEHKHPHIPHLVKEELKEIADSNPFAILHEVFNKEASEEETFTQQMETNQNETDDKTKIKNESDKNEIQALFLGYLEKSRKDAYSRLCLTKCVEEGERLRRMLKFRDVSLFNVDVKSCPSEELVGELKQKRMQLALAQAEFRAENMVNSALRKLRSVQDLQKVRDMVEEERLQQITLQNMFKEISDLERKITLNSVIKMEEEERQRRVDEMRLKNSGSLFSDKNIEPKTLEQLEYEESVGGACF